MSPLALAIYDILRVRVPAKSPELSYTDLINQLPTPWNALEPDSKALREALGELVVGCRAKGLPAISAMVVRHIERIPGIGYYPVAHPKEAHDTPLAMVAWANELQLVRQTTYPPVL